MSVFTAAGVGALTGVGRYPATGAFGVIGVGANVGPIVVSSAGACAGVATVKGVTPSKKGISAIVRDGRKPAHGLAMGEESLEEFAAFLPDIVAHIASQYYQPRI